MRRTSLTLALLVAALALPLAGPASPGLAFSSGAYGGFSGAPGEDTCRHCHKSFPLNVGGGTLTITGFPETYVPGETYHVTVSIANPTAIDWGFQATVLSEAKRPVGRLLVTDRAHTKVVPGIFLTDRLYVEQKEAGHYDDQREGASWTFDWRAPKKAKGAITIYAAGNAGNDNHKVTGDFIYTAKQTALPAS